MVSYSETNALLLFFFFQNILSVVQRRNSVCDSVGKAGTRKIQKTPVRHSGKRTVLTKMTNGLEQ